MKGLGSLLNEILLQGEGSVDGDLCCDLGTGEDGVEVEGRDAILEGDELLKICFSNLAFSFLILSVFFFIVEVIFPLRFLK